MVALRRCAVAPGGRGRTKRGRSRSSGAPKNHGDAFPFAPEVLAHAFFPAPAVPEPIAGRHSLQRRLHVGCRRSQPLRHLQRSAARVRAQPRPRALDEPVGGDVSDLSRHRPGPDSTEDIRAIQTLYAPTVRGVLPLGWADTAIGGAIKGEAVERSGIYTVTAAGRDVWGSRDELRFVSRTLSGDGDITARIDSLKAVHPWTKAGIMIRASADPGAPARLHARVGRKGAGVSAAEDAERADDEHRRRGGSCSRWLLRCRGGARESLPTAAVTRGAWHLVATDTININEQVLAGLALSGHDAAAPSTAVFSSVSVVPAPASTGPGPGTSAK